MSLLVKSARRGLAVLTALVTTSSAVVALPDGRAAAAGPDHELSLVTLSAKPELVTGDDVLVAARAPDDVPLASVRLELNGTDVTGALVADDAHTLTGVVEDLRPGRNRLVARAGPLRDEVVVTNHPATGPVISGPHETPFICSTEQFRLVGGATLGAPLDEDCSIATRVDYAYRSTDGQTKPLPDLTSRPSDLAWTTTITGATVPFLIRIETGTVNRSIYQISMLHDPATEPPTLQHRSPGWNDRLIYTFGGGCRRGWYTQGANTGGVVDAHMLGRGYAVASASLNVFGNNCNDLLAAETMMMVKERFVEGYGTPRFTIGWGSSGGSYQGHQISDNYPGLLDGIVVGRTFPDVISATNFTLFDSRLLEHYFTEVAQGEFTEEEQRQVSGFLRWQSIHNLSVGANRLDPAAEFPSTLPTELHYDPLTNPEGARGDVYDHAVNMFGRDPATGFARRPLDNVGVQYGLAALNSGAITTEQFLDLNENIGGLDIDLNPTAARTPADPIATRAAYRTGRILSGGAGLAATPVIDYRSYSEDAPNGDIHMSIHGFATRARLEAMNGDADNQVMLIDDGRYGGFNLNNPALQYALTNMDEWLTALADDEAPGSGHEKVVRNKPEGLVEGCWSRDAAPRRIVQRLTPDNTGECGQLYPVASAPRLVAGAPVADNVVTCHRKAVDWADYRVTFTPQERSRLRTIFPSGVCDWSKPGIGWQALQGTWQTFRPS